MMTRKEFLEQVMKMANLKDLKQADEATQAVISLTKLIIGPKLSQKIAKASPPDLREGWEAIKPVYPKRAIKVMTGPGGEDLDIREMTPSLQKYLGVEIAVENIVGFWGKIPFEKFQEMEPDGYTFICYTFPRSIIIEQTGGTRFKSKAFTPVFAWSLGHQFLVVPSESFQTFDAFLREAKHRTLMAAVPIKGGINHLLGLLLAEGLGIQVKWISYGGLAPSISALTRREVDFTISLGAALASPVKAGRVKMLAMIPEKSGRRSLYFQQVPTLKELGYEIPTIMTRHVLEAPPGTPPHIVTVLEEAIRETIRKPSYLEWARKNFVSIDPIDAQSLAREKEEAYSLIERVKEKLKEE